jgi:hypothetical protein
MSAYSQTCRVTHLMCIDARIEWIIGYWVFVRSLDWDPGHHERFRNGPENKIHIKESSFWILEKFRSLSVLYRNVLEGSRVGPLWGHLTEACVGLKGSVLATWARCTKPLRPSRPSPRGNHRANVLEGGGKLAPHSSPTLAAGLTATLHFSLSRLHVGEALLQKFSTISTMTSCCWSNLSLHHTCWTKEGGDIAAPYVCISRRRRHLRCWIGSDREEEMASTTTLSMFCWTFPLCDFFKGIKISSISLVDYIS